MALNQNPEQLARDQIDALLRQSGWAVQNLKDINLNDGLGQAIREYQTDVGPADYVLFVNKKAVGVIEAKREDEGHHLTKHESQTEGYAGAKLKWVNNKDPLPFLYESTGVITRFTDARDPKPRSHEVFSFHRPETIQEWLEQGVSLKGRLQTIPALNPGHLPASELHLRDCQEVAISNGIPDINNLGLGDMKYKLAKADLPAISSESAKSFHLISKGVNIPNNLKLPDVFIETL